MASSLPSSCSLNLHNNCCRLKEHNKYLQVRSQSFSDDGTSANIVDSNMRVLRERIAEVKVKERLDKCYYCKSLNNNGWNYGSGYDHKHKRINMLCECFEVLSFAASALGLVLLSGSLSICLVSLLVHLN